MTSVENLVSRYVAVWNEPDPSRRRQAIAGLWTEDGAHFTPSLEARGYEVIEARISGAHDRFVRAEGYVFSAAHTGPAITTRRPSAGRCGRRAAARWPRVASTSSCSATTAGSATITSSREPSHPR